MLKTRMKMLIVDTFDVLVWFDEGWMVRGHFQMMQSDVITENFLFVLGYSSILL
jgi:hypothetical protein